MPYNSLEKIRKVMAKRNMTPEMFFDYVDANRDGVVDLKDIT